MSKKPDDKLISELFAEYRQRQVCNIDEFKINMDNSVEDKALSALTDDEIKRAINDLSERDSDILYFLLFKNYAPKDIAKLLGISARNIRRMTGS